VADLGHDVVQALGSSPLTHRLNAHIDEDHRATLNSVANLVQRTCIHGHRTAGGFMVDKTSLNMDMVVIGLACSALALVATTRLRSLRAFS